MVRAKGSENMTNESRKRIGLNIAEQYAESALLFLNKYKNHRLADLDRNKAMAVIGVLHAIGLLKQSEYSKKMEELCQLFDKKRSRHGGGNTVTADREEYPSVRLTPDSSP